MKSSGARLSERKMQCIAQLPTGAPLRVELSLTDIFSGRDTELVNSHDMTSETEPCYWLRVAVNASLSADAL
jgi:nitrate/nitrite transporter NarK